MLKNNEWTMSRALDSKMLPDSVGVRHIVLPYAQEALADSLLTVLKKGGDFAQTAARYSVYDATAANGGEVGVLPFSAFTGEFAAALANARQGDIVKIASGDAIQLMQVYRADKPSKHVQVATITYPVEASAATRRDVHNQAGSFMVNAKGSAAAFADAASTAAVTPRVAAIAQGDRTIRGLEDSREVARWAYGAKEGDLSAILPLRLARTKVFTSSAAANSRPTSVTLFSSASRSSSVGETSNTTYEIVRDGVCLNWFLWLL